MRVREREKDRESVCVCERGVIVIEQVSKQGRVTERESEREREWRVW